MSGPFSHVCAVELRFRSIEAKSQWLERHARARTATSIGDVPGLYLYRAKVDVSLGVHAKKVTLYLTGPEMAWNGEVGEDATFQVNDKARFAGRLEAFLRAGHALLEAWPQSDVEDYPSYLPSFDEFLAQFGAIRPARPRTGA